MDWVETLRIWLGWVFAGGIILITVLTIWAILGDD